MTSKYRPKQYTQQEKERLVNLYLSDDLHITEFCIFHSLRRMTFAEWLKKRNLKCKNLHKLSSKQKLAIYRMSEIGIKYKEIAEILNLAEVTIKMNLIKIRRKIRETGQLP